jgi:hypothetical protein
VPREIVYYLSIAKSSLDETADELLDGLESGYWSQAEYNDVRSLLRRTHGAIRGWWRYLESPAAHRFYASHREKIERDIKTGLRRPPKDPASRPWRQKTRESLDPQTANPANPANPENLNRRTRRTPNPKNPENLKNPENPSNP